MHLALRSGCTATQMSPPNENPAPLRSHEPQAAAPGRAFRGEQAMAPHSNTLAWKIPWTEEPVGGQSIGSLGVGHD